MRLLLAKEEEAGREALLAQAVLKGKTKGYLHHPQLSRFRASASPSGSIAAYLRSVHAESLDRGYRFDATRIGRGRAAARIPVTRGQLGYEWRHLMKKLKTRDQKRRAFLATVKHPRPHPLFRAVRGGVADWEKI